MVSNMRANLSRRALLVASAAVMASEVRAATLFDDLGGRAGIAGIIDRLFVIALADPRIAAQFDNINVQRLKGRLAEYICQLAGGPCAYHGVSMAGAHRGLHLTDIHFNAMVEDLQAAMDQAGIAFRTQNRLIALLAPSHRDVVSR